MYVGSVSETADAVGRASPSLRAEEVTRKHRISELDGLQDSQCLLNNQKLSLTLSTSFDGREGRVGLLAKLALIRGGHSFF